MPQKCSSALPKPWSNSQVSHGGFSAQALQTAPGGHEAAFRGPESHAEPWVICLGSAGSHPPECSSIERFLAGLYGHRPLALQRLWQCWQLWEKKNTPRAQAPDLSDFLSLQAPSRAARAAC